jgi:hypothetical protein
MDGEWWRALEAPLVRWIIIAFVVMAFVTFYVAPEDRRKEFFVVTLLTGPLGLVGAAVSQPRPATKVTPGAAMSDFLFGETARRFRQRRKGRGSDKERGAGGGSIKQ